MDEENRIQRSVLRVMAFELEGLCEGLRNTVPHGLNPSHTTIGVINRLLADFSEKADGCVLDDLPPLDESTSPVDMLIVAEILRASLMAFLTPDEREERERLFGFHSEDG